MKIERYILKNTFLEVHVLNYGGVIDKIYCANRDGKMENVVLSYQDVNDYINIPGPYLNTLVGPTAGRIANGQYHNRVLSCNDGQNHLHGGYEGVSQTYFMMEQESATCLHARLVKSHEKDGYQGTFTYHITYTLEDNQLVLNYEADCTDLNLLYMTSHLYFNLSGDLKKSIKDHQLTSAFEKMMMIGMNGAPERIETIEKGSCFDFSQGKILKEVLNSNHPQFAYTRGIDHPFFTHGPIVLSEMTSGRVLTIQSDSPCAVLYSANFIDETMTFQGNIKGYPHIALAIELQDVANGVHFGLGEERKHYTQRTVYAFYRI